MSRKYSQKQFQSPWSTTDQKVQQIMKKYQKAPQPRNAQPRTPLATQNFAQPSEKSPWKKQYYCTPPPCKQPYQGSNSKQNYSNHRQYENHQTSYRKKDEYPHISKYKPHFNDSYTYERNYHPNESFNMHEEDEILEAKKFLERKEKKYLKTQNIQNITARPKRQSVNKHIRQSQRTNDQYKKAFDNIEYEPRINNLERINNKIKKILDCTLNNQTSFLEQQITPNSYQLKKEIPNRNTNPFKIQEEQARNPRQKSIKEGRQIYERSKSCLNLKKKFMASKDTPKVKQPVPKVVQPQSSKQKSNNAAKKPYINTEFLLPSSNIKSSNHSKSTKNIEQSNDSKLHQYEEIDKNFHSPSLGLRQLDYQIPQNNYETIKQGQPNETILSDNNQLNNAEQMNQVIKGMQLRKKKLDISAFDSHKSQQMKKFFKILSEQVQLDQRLQLSKKKFRLSPSYNLTALQQLLSARWRQMSIEEVEAQLAIKLEEEDPFYSYCQEQFQVEDLVRDYIICSRHWREKIQGKWSISKLKQSSLFQRLDLENKGYFNIQDLVRQINLNEGVFYRNRNLYLIFQRMAQDDQVAQISEDRLYSVLGQK